jgi:uncharacterized metal-binding protein YceD (DUF177 family)
MKTSKLQLAVREIPNAGRTIDHALPTEWVRESLLDAYTALSPLEMSLTATPVGNAVRVHGEFELTVTFACSRTLKPGQRRIAVKVNELFQPGTAETLNLDGGLDTEVLSEEPYTYVDGELDLEALIREQLVLAQEPYPVLDENPSDTDNGPVWPPKGTVVDPRWSALQELELN